MNRDNLVAKIEIIDGESLIDSAKYLKKFVDYDKQNSVDAVIAELPDGLAERIETVLNGPKEEYHFSKTGHLFILFNYLQNNRKVPVHYTSISKYEKVLSDVKKEMHSKNQKQLYQFCTAVNKEKVKSLLEKEGFTLI